MAVYKNKASQKVACFAYDSTDGSAKTGNAAQITAQISLDGGVTAATNDANPDELEATDASGIYIFTLTQAETNADLVIIAPVSATANILIEPLIIYTEPEQRVAASVTAGVSLADDAITSAKFDESTAFPLASADTGATALARTGADSDTLETLSDQLDATATAANLATVAGYLDTEIASILEDTGTTLPGLISGVDGKIDTIDGIVDAILADTGTDGVVVAAGSKTGYSLTANTGLGNQTANITGNLSGSVGSVTGAINTGSGTITTLDALDTAQDSQHSTTQTHLTDIKGATWASGTDTLEAIRDRGDAAWITATGFMPSSEDGSSFTAIPDMATATNQTAIAGYLDTEIAAILEDTSTTIPATLAGLATAANLATAQADLDTITDTGVTCVALTSAAFADMWATDTLTESYAADGAAPTPAQAMYLIQQALTEFAIAGTTITVKQLNGSTTAATFTLDDGTTPTSRTRAS